MFERRPYDWRLRCDVCLNFAAFRVSVWCNVLPFCFLAGLLSHPVVRCVFAWCFLSFPGCRVWCVQAQGSSSPSAGGRRKKRPEPKPQQWQVTDPEDVSGTASRLSCPLRFLSGSLHRVSLLTWLTQSLAPTLRFRTNPTRSSSTSFSEQCSRRCVGNVAESQTTLLQNYARCVSLGPFLMTRVLTPPSPLLHLLAGLVLVGPHRQQSPAVLPEACTAKAGRTGV